MKVFIETLESIKNKIYPYNSFYNNSLKTQDIPTKKEDWHIYLNENVYVNLKNMFKCFNIIKKYNLFYGMFRYYFFKLKNHQDYTIESNNLKYINSKIINHILLTKNFSSIEEDILIKIKQQIKLLSK